MAEIAPASTTTNTGLKSTRFDTEAANWDANPFVHQMSAEAWKALQKHIPALRQQDSAKTLDVLEIGCGTGLLTFMVAPHIHEIVAVDAATGMIEKLKSKVAASGSTNIIPLAVLLEDPEDERLPPAGPKSKDGGTARRKYDLIISHLVLHHIPDLKDVLITMFGCLKSGGMIALTDFEDFGPEAKRFHPRAKMEGVERHGINARWIEELIREVGFEDAQAKVAWEHEKKVEKWSGEFESKKVDGAEQGEKMNFTYLLCTGRKP